MTQTDSVPNQDPSSLPTAASTTPCTKDYSGTAPQSDRIVLRYKTRGARAVLFAVAGLAPVWALWAPYAAISILRLGAPDQESLSVLVLSLCLVSAALIAIGCSLDAEVVIDPVGISFPIRFLPWTWSFGRLPWSSLRSVIYRPSEQEDFYSRLVLKFDRRAVPLVVGGLSKEDLRRLVLSAQTHCREPADLNTFSTDDSSFTAIWQKELSSRFSPTVFVPLSPATTLKGGEVEILGQSACGGLSAIYMAKLRDGRKVIVKEAVVPAQADEATRKKAMELFAREASLLRTIDHPRISKVLDHFSEDNRHYLVLEHVAGVDLRRFVRDNGRQHEEIVLRWAIDIADVLEYLHELSPPVIHRDLTPDNLIFTANGGISVIDFGAANAFVSEATGTLVGKQAYIAPEQFRGHATPQSDVYSLGCTMYFLLTAVDPEPLAVSHPKLLNVDLSDGTDQFVALCTETELSSRLDSAGTAAARLRGILTTRRSASKAGG